MVSENSGMGVSLIREREKDGTLINVVSSLWIRNIQEAKWCTGSSSIGDSGCSGRNGKAHIRRVAPCSKICICGILSSSSMF
ncbi:hypothetical protein CY34DRAFT_809991 [Suillus luteus UH-Slu-Lm8-n1]|uniref:Uncharacterized protein n=1 Tax=Suillus luteus UH-Slu-Lm8-n1 TaxID=930992 RepID=A0A0D0AU18_9AGAM|nr:hypothetical protein CY34DRAFT_809991 [Suillus luteus UH-Slu-Lm8-n1]